MAGLFQVLHGKGDGTFGEVTVLNGTDGEPLTIKAKEENSTKAFCTRPFAADWDGDDDLDLIVGNFEGSFFLFTGKGKGKFQPEPVQMLAEGAPLRIAGAHSDPCVIDWDGDGDLDIVSGSSQGGVQWAENTAGKEKTPVLKKFRDLIPSQSGGKQGMDPTVFTRKTLDDLGGPSTSSRIWVCDLNGDSKLDILLGDGSNLIDKHHSLSAEEFDKRYKEWASTFQGIMDEMRALKDFHAPEARPIQKRMQAHWQKRSELVRGKNDRLCLGVPPKIG